MPQTVTTDEAGRIRIRLSGIVNRREFEQMFAELKAAESAFAVIPDRITDIREVINMETGYTQMLPSARARTTMKFPNSFRSAVVAVTPVQFGLARMFMTLNSNPQIEMGIFRSVEEAEEWLVRRPAPVAAVV